jgi:hypothetical protein
VTNMTDDFKSSIAGAYDAIKPGKPAGARPG